MSSYFSEVPNFEYVSRLPDAKISDYIIVKNFFKKGFLREDIFQNLAFFTKYSITGNDRPDNVAFEIYKDSSLDWLVLMSNNIVNIQNEWPISNRDFDELMLEKYGSYDTLFNGIHHYKTIEVKDALGVKIVNAGLKVESDYSVTFFDDRAGGMRTVTPTIPVTNYQYEQDINEGKRNIYLLQPRYLQVVRDDLEDLMTYREGSTQYVSETLKRADNIRLFS
jgi:hypothetical protein|tara:strand:- start:61 stop:726 length:666 start_codon:yes stop_codon:yes gene_type:complete